MYGYNRYDFDDFMEDALPMILLILVVSLIINLVIANLMAKSIKLKGYKVEEVHPFPIVFFLGIIGVLYLMTLPDLIQRTQNQKIIELLDKSNKISKKTLNVIYPDKVQTKNYKTDKTPENINNAVESVNVASDKKFCYKCGAKMKVTEKICPNCYANQRKSEIEN